MSEFKYFQSCPVCQEQSEQCLTCASHVVDGERIYYEKLKNFGATQDHELRFIQSIQKYRTTAFFHKGKLYIPSRQGRSVPLAIGLQWEAWQDQQAKVEELQTHAQEIHKREIKLFEKTLILTHERDELQKRVDTALKKLDKRRDELWPKWKGQADMQDQGAANAFEEAYWILEQALKGESDD